MLLGGVVLAVGCSDAGVEGDEAPQERHSAELVTGQWQKVTFPSITVAAAMMPNGKIVAWSSEDRYTFGDGTTQTYTALFDPQTMLVQDILVTNTNHDMFCPGTSMLPDGRLMVTGGGANVPSVSVYDSSLASWSAESPLNQARWYNAQVTLPTGDVFTLGGNLYGGNVDDGRGERWSPGKGWTLLSGAPITPLLTGVMMNRAEEHPRLFVAPNGKVFIPGPNPNMFWYDVVSGTGTYTAAGTRGNDTFSQNDVTVMYAPGKLLKAGGNVAYDRPAPDGTTADKMPSSATSYVIDINTNTPAVHQVPSMLRGRAFANGVVLASGEVLVTGGLDNAKAFTDVGAVLIPELFDPTTETWSDVTTMTVPRTYHSVALLMPDGRVFTGGGGLCGQGCDANHFDAEIFTPDFLNAAPRPAITAGPTSANYNQSISVTATGTITGFAWIRMASVTHSMNTDQRRLPATFTAGANNTYSIVTPANANLAPPGYYMLFALNGKSPSVAKIIQIVAAGTPATEAPPPAGGLACTAAAENNLATLTCPSGQIIKSIDFASFGNSSGQCGAFVKGSCDNSANAISVMQTNCVGKASCVVRANGSNFVDPCSGTVKTLRVQAHCDTDTSTPPTTSTQCATGGEYTNAQLSCPVGQVIKSVDFASYGNPTGSCGAFKKNSCDATTSTQTVSNSCVGQNSCVIAVGNSTFGTDPCYGTTKSFAAQVTCAAPGTGSPVTAVCSTAAEWANATLSCPTGNVITGITFASYGTPAGACNNFTKGTCDASSSVSALTTACVGKQTCSVPATNTTFGDPCSGTTKQLYAQASCGTTAPASTPVCAAVAEWANATLTCPTGKTIKSVDFASFGTPKGSCGSFTAGTCNATNSKTAVSTACLNKATCTVPATNTTFGDPCSGTVKSLDVQVTCM